MQLFDEVFATPSGCVLRYDLFRPDTDEILPLVVCFHGGGWISGERSGMHEIALLLSHNGYTAACPAYRLAPLYPFPAAVQDAQAFVRYAREHAAELKVDPERIASLGNSAGGHLASMLGVLDRLPDDPPDTPSARVQAVVDICGITDVTNPMVQHLPISWSFLEQFMQVPFEGNEDVYRLASPLHHVDTTAAKFLIFHGEDDDIVPINQSEKLHAALKAAGVKSEFYRYPCEGHAFSYGRYIEMAQTTLRFLKENL